MEDTAKNHFGGGDTAWEESRLGSYARRWIFNLRTNFPFWFQFWWLISSMLLGQQTILIVEFLPSKKFIFIYFNENPFKSDENDYYFILKTLSFLRYLHFSPEFLVM